jgi:hypothetical protein
LRLEGWSRQRRIVIFQRRLERSVALAERDDVGQLRLSFAEVDDGGEVWEYAVLLTSLDSEILSIGQLYRDRADCVRLNNRVLSFASTLPTAFETVALDSFSSVAAPEKERVSATFAKIAKPSRSGSFDMSNPETICFDKLYFQLALLSIGAVSRERGSPEDHDDRMQTF